jgi:hypothetical protein
MRKNLHQTTEREMREMKKPMRNKTMRNKTMRNKKDIASNLTSLILTKYGVGPKYGSY